MNDRGNPTTDWVAHVAYFDGEGFVDLFDYCDSVEAFAVGC